MPAADTVPGLRWLGHATVLLDGPPVVYIDPWRLEGRKGLPRADLVLVTHAHFDHAAPESTAWIAGPETVFAGPAEALALLSGGGERRALVAGDEIGAHGCRVRAFESRDESCGFHPPETGLGFLVEGAGPVLLHLGDGTRWGSGSDAPPRFDPPPEVVAVAVGGAPWPDSDAAARAASATGATHALPIHWGALQGSHHDAARFRDALGCLAPSMRTILRRIPERSR